MTSKSIVDAQGNINGGVLQVELQEALQSDVRHKLIDNMKKRAVKVATDYDEFKAMVSCAHLKKLTSKEVESLSAAKKGWKKSHVIDTSTNMQILSKEFQQEDMNVDIIPLKSTKVKAKLPKTCMELDRDLRRKKTMEEKKRLLKSIGCKKTISMLSQGGDTDILEQILIILVAEIPESIEDCTTEDLAFENLIEWLTLLTECSQFSMMVELATKELLDQVQRKLINNDSNCEVLLVKYQNKCS